jgi:hypothetical protein
MGLPMGFEAWVTFLSCDWAIAPVAAYPVCQFVVTIFLVTGQLQVLAGITVDII